MGITPFLGPNR